MWNHLSKKCQLSILSGLARCFGEPITHTYGHTHLGNSVLRHCVNVSGFVSDRDSCRHTQNKGTDK